MDRSSTSGVGRVFQGWAIVLAVVVSCCVVPLTHAQKNVRMTSRNVTAYSELLELDPGQTEIAYALHAEYMSDIEAVAEKHRGAMGEMKAAYSGVKDLSDAREQARKITRAFEKESARVEADFFRDLRLVLDERQAAQWPRLDRLRRRETTLRQGWYSGEGIDLIVLTKAIAGERDLGLDVAAALETYELQIDRVLVTKAREMAEMRDAISNPKRPLAQSDYDEMGQTKKSVGLHVRNVNRRHARVIESLLPEDLAQVFHNELLRRTFPKVYGKSRTDRLFAATDQLNDLSSEQRASIDQLHEAYTRQRAAANGRWSVAIIERENDAGNTGSAKESYAQRPTVDTPLGPVAKARRIRRDLDERYMGKVIALLTPSQQQALPSLTDPNSKKTGKDE